MRCIAIVGPTASGKTKRAVDIARSFDSEIISADSRQVYRGMDIGTGKDVEEYGEIPVHLLDVAEAGEKYNLHRYITDFRAALSQIREKGKVPVVCGGSGMYVEAVLSGIVLPQVDPDPALRASLEGKSLEELTDILRSFKTLHNSTDVDCIPRAVRAIEIESYYAAHPEEAALADKYKATPVDSLIIGVDIPRDARRDRISRRLDERLGQGMVDEVKTLLAAGISPEDLIYYGLEYKFLTNYILGDISYKEMHDGLEIAIHQFAKRQMTWFRGMERRGFRIEWLPFDLSAEEFTQRVRDLYFS